MEILRYTPINKGAVQGSFDVKIPSWNFVIRGCTLLMKNGHRWVNMPSESYEEAGEKRYKRHCYFDDKDITERFNKAVIKAIEDYAVKHSDEELKNEEGVPF